MRWRLPFASWLLSLLLCALPARASTMPEVRLLVGPNWAAPLALFEGETLTGGIFKDLAQALAEATGWRVTIAVIPRARQERVVAAGEIDLMCLMSPAWLDQPQAYLWGKRPIFRSADVIVGAPGVAALQALDQLPPGTALGTTRGYKYPALQERFDAGRLARDDAPDEAKLLLKVGAGRNAYGIVNSLSADWYRAKERRYPIAPWQIEVEASDVFCAVPRSSPAPAAELLAQVDRLVSSGQMQRILARYR